MEEGTYALWAEIASEEVRPLKVTCNHSVLSTNAVAIVTGEYTKNKKEKIKIADVNIYKGMNTVAFSSENPFPALYSIILDEK